MHTESSYILAVHSIPHFIEPQVEDFWVLLNNALRSNNKELLLISTTPVSSLELNTIKIPFNLTELNDTSVSEHLPSSDHPRVLLIKAWYKTSDIIARQTYFNVLSFVNRIFSLAQPYTVLSWQSAHPLSRVLRDACQVFDIPCFSAERGWLNNTLMFDLCENNALTEINRSIPVARGFRRYIPTEEVLLRLSKRSSLPLGRYPSSTIFEAVPLHRRVGISEDVPIWVFFTHGEPHIYPQAASLKNSHGLNHENVVARFLELSRILERRGIALLVKEHPFNAKSGYALNLSGLSNVFEAPDDIEQLLLSAQMGIFTLSTLQFTWALRGKPLGLLCKGLLSGEGLAPEWGEYGDPESFVDACLDIIKSTSRMTAVQRRIAFLFEYQLLDLNAEEIESSANELAHILLNQPN